MQIERFFVPGLARVSYLVASGREAVAQEAATNWAFQLNDRACFIESMAANLPSARPTSHDQSRSICAVPFLSQCSKAGRLRLAEFDALQKVGTTILDVRPSALFGEAHAAGSLNIGVASPSFSVWCGFFVTPICLSYS